MIIWVARKQEVLRATEQLLGAITSGDFVTYTRLVEPSLSCFEPEAGGQLIEGTDFHRFYFDACTFSISFNLHTTIISFVNHVVLKQWKMTFNIRGYINTANKLVFICTLIKYYSAQNNQSTPVLENKGKGGLYKR